MLSDLHHKRWMQFLLEYLYLLNAELLSFTTSLWSFSNSKIHVTMIWQFTVFDFGLNDFT